MGYSYYFEKRRKKEKDNSCIYDALIYFFNHQDIMCVENLFLSRATISPIHMLEEGDCWPIGVTMPKFSALGQL